MGKIPHSAMAIKALDVNDSSYSATASDDHRQKAPFVLQQASHSVFLGVYITQFDAIPSCMLRSPNTNLAHLGCNVLLDLGEIH